MMNTYFTENLVSVILLNVLILIPKTSTLNTFVKTQYNDVIVLEHFWKSTGFCPSGDPNSRGQFLLSKDEKINLDIIGTLPNSAITHIRIHWLLDLVKVKGESNDPNFDFSSLDVLLDRLHQNNLHPIFELMGNPSNYFYDFKAQSEQWTNLIKKILSRYRRFYGMEFVKNWSFELTNEPDLKLYNRFNFTLETYVDYFRASESAVETLAGPAGLFRSNKKVHPLCWGFLNYCNLNPCNLNLITFHRKGYGTGRKVVDGSLELINLITSNYSNLGKISFGNDEADIQKSWIKPFQWRADVRYAALVVQVIIGHVKKLLVERRVPFRLLSNDNGFLSYSPNYFTQRTLLARFQMNNTKPQHVQFFKKPVYSVFALMSLMGTQVKDIVYGPGKAGISYMVTSDEWRDAFIIVIVDDRADDEFPGENLTDSRSLSLKVKLKDSALAGRYVGYRMSNHHGNPYKVWLDAGKPDFPDFNLRREMRKAEGFAELFNRPFEPHQTYVELALKNVSVPHVLLLNVCFENAAKAGRVAGLRHEKIFENEILLLWKDTFVRSRCVLTYVVEFRRSPNETFFRINAGNSIFLHFHFDGRHSNGSFIGVKGEYRVAAVDYWNRKGLFSNILTVY